LVWRKLFNNVQERKGLLDSCKEWQEPLLPAKIQDILASLTKGARVLRLADALFPKIENFARYLMTEFF